MRLVCPNCDAQYDVDDALVPPEGRDVQCSNCTTTWFQGPPSSADDTPAEAEQPTPESPYEPDEDDAQEEANDSGSDNDVMAAAAAIAGSGSDKAHRPPPPRPKLDPDALEVINEEVERETQARQTESPDLETQPDLGLEDGDSELAASAARDRMARRRGLPTHAEIEDTGEGDVTSEIVEASDANSKRELLPDIEEINSTLAEAPEQAAEEISEAASDPNTSRKARSGFRLGFGLMLLTFAGLILLYLLAPNITEKYPQVADPLQQYVTAVDAFRVWLDATAESLVEQINGLIGRITGKE